jgi:tetratricopeptide (TPR) repeat protein
MRHSRARLIGSFVAAGLLGAVSVFVQIERDRRYATDRPAEQVLYVQSPDVMKRMVLSYDLIAADIYWIRAIQHFGRERQSHAAEKHYALLYPLLNICTSLDPRFNLAYRFGATFLSEAPPGGPGRPDQAIALLKKGIAAMPEKWQYYQDAGFVEYWVNHDYAAAADWFAKGAERTDAPWWLKLLAANTLAKGGDRESSRMLYRLLLQSGENDFMKQDAARRLRQLDALDELEQLTVVVARYREAGGRPPFTWQALGAAGLLRRLPQDPDGFDYVIHPETGHVDLDQQSTLWPLPAEPPKAPTTTGPSR